MANFQHIKEWKESAIAPDLIETNLVSLDGIDTLNRLLYSDELPRTNTGVLTSGYLKKYDHLYHGGWYCRSWDPLTKDEMDWVQLKPNQPRKSWKKKEYKGFSTQKKEEWKQNIIKYETPPKTKARIILPFIPTERWEAIAKKYQVEISDKYGKWDFWQWVIDNPQLPITITEGGKKTLSLLSHNIIALGLPGVWMGTRKINPESKIKELTPDLKLFALKERQFNIAFDSDIKPKTVKAVSKAIFALCSTLVANESKAFVLSWEHELGKGIDDVLFNSGENASELLHQIFALKKSFSFWATSYLHKLSRVDLRLNSRYLSDVLKVLPENRLVALKSPQGTGKTEVIASVLQNYLREGIPCFVLVHLESLAKALSKRFGVPYRTEKDPTRNYYGYSLCVDSCMRKANGVDPDNWEDVVIVIDEVEQVINHLLNGCTTIAKYRPTVLNTLVELLAKSKQVIIADADLSDISVNLFSKLLDEKAFIVQNDYKYQGMNFYRHTRRESLHKRIGSGIKSGKKLFITSTSQKARGKYSTKAIEHYVNKHFPNLKVLRIDSQSIANNEHPALGCLGNINQIITGYDVVIASPSIQTGVSIDVLGYFDEVIAFSSGNVTPNAFLQQIWRLRDENCPRHFYAPKTGINFIGNSSSSPKEILESTNKTAKFTVNQLGFLDCELSMDSIDSAFLESYAKISARQNASNRCYSELLDHLIKHQGHCLEIIETDRDQTQQKIIKENAAECQEIEYQKILEAPNLTDDEIEILEKICQEKGLTEIEQHSIKKHSVKKRYQDVNFNLLDFDDDGKYPQLKLFYYLTIGNQFLKGKDTATVKKMTKDNKGKVLSFDIQKKTYTAKVKALKAINLMDLVEYLIDGKAVTTKDPKIAELLELVRKNKKDFSAIGVQPSKYAISTLNRMLGLIGHKLVASKVDGKTQYQKIEGETFRLYYLEKLPAFTQPVLEKWLKLDSESVTNLQAKVTNLEGKNSGKPKRQNQYKESNVAVTNFLIRDQKNKFNEDKFFDWEKAEKIIKKYIHQPLEKIWNALEQELKTLPDEMAELIADTIMEVAV